MDVVPDAVRMQIDDVPLTGRSGGRGWLYAPRGVEAFGQQELVMVVRQVPGGARAAGPPVHPPRHHPGEAVAGRAVEAGWLTKIDPPPRGPRFGGFLRRGPGEAGRPEWFLGGLHAATPDTCGHLRRQPPTLDELDRYLEAAE